MLSSVLKLPAFVAAVLPDPYFPGFHVRPLGGHNNVIFCVACQFYLRICSHEPAVQLPLHASFFQDPNGPFWDPKHDRYHLFMVKSNIMFSIANLSHKNNAYTHQQYHSYLPRHGGMGWYHFSSDDLAHWVALDGTNPSSNITGIPTDGVGCPNTQGCFSGSTTVTNINGSMVPTIVYPGVHHVPKDADHPDGKSHNSH